MKIGLFGGTFNPIHVGHLIVANAAANLMDLDKVLFIPAMVNPFKQNEKESTDYNIRCEMIRLAIKDNDKLGLSLIQQSLPIPSYTIDTLRLLKDNDEGNDYVLIIGSDLLYSLNQWKDYQEIINNYEIYYYERLGFDLFNVKFKNIESSVVDISSTLIRKLIKEDKDIKYLVPDSVISLIKKHKLYKK